MLLRLFFLLGICQLIGIIHSKKNESFCTPFNTSTGPIPPVVPESFIMLSEFFTGKGRTETFVEYEEYYFDSMDVRAKYVRATNGTEFHYIFDYETERIITYQLVHPGWHIERDVDSHNTCVSQPMSGNPLKNIFGFRNELTGHKKTKMYNAENVLKFGGEFPYSSLHKSDFGFIPDPDRNMTLHSFISCYYDKYTDATEETKYFWTTDKVVPSSMANDAFYDKFLPRSVPTKRVSRSVVSDFTSDFTQNIMMFWRDPPFDESTFNVPPYIQCKDYERFTAEDIPKIADFFSTRMEQYMIIQNNKGVIQSIENTYSELWYDKVSDLIRFDITLEPETSNDDQINQEPELVSYIYDFRTGFRTFIRRTYATCDIRPIELDDRFKSKKPSLFLLIAEPNEIFQITEDLKYKGQYYARDIYSSVWAGEIKTDADDDNATFYKEIYFSADGWHSLAEQSKDSHVPVMQTEVFTYPDNNQTLIQTNFFRFEQVPPHLSVYSVAECLEQWQHEYFSFSIYDETLQDEILKNRRVFLDSAHKAIVNYGKLVSLIRVQDISFGQHSKNYLVVEFALLERPEGDVSTTLSDAVINIRTAVDNSSFSIKLEFRIEFPKEIFVKKGSFAVLDRDLEDNSMEKMSFKRENNLEINKNEHTTQVNKKEEHTTESLRNNIIEQNDQLEKLKQQIHFQFLNSPKLHFFPGIAMQSNMPHDISYSDSNDDSDEKKYDSGTTAAVAIVMLLVGAFIGIGLMYFYIKKYAKTDMVDNYPLQESKEFQS